MSIHEALILRVDVWDGVNGCSLEVLMRLFWLRVGVVWFFMLIDFSRLVILRLWEGRGWGCDLLHSKLFYDFLFDDIFCDDLFCVFAFDAGSVLLRFVVFDEFFFDSFVVFFLFDAYPFFVGQFSFWQFFPWLIDWCLFGWCWEGEFCPFFLKNVV